MVFVVQPRAMLMGLLKNSKSDIFGKLLGPGQFIIDMLGLFFNMSNGGLFLSWKDEPATSQIYNFCK